MTTEKAFSKKQVVETLTKASEELLTRGWGKGDMMKYTGEVCAVGALAVAAGEEVIITDGYEGKKRHNLASTKKANRVFRSKAFRQALADVIGNKVGTHYGTKAKTIAGNWDEAKSALIRFNDGVCKDGRELNRLFVKVRDKLVCGL